VPTRALWPCSLGFTRLGSGSASGLVGDATARADHTSTDCLIAVIAIRMGSPALALAGNSIKGAVS